MNNLVNKLYIKALLSAQKLKKMISDERGDTNIVAIILILVIVIGLVIAFKGTIEGLVETILGKIRGDVGNVLN